MVTLHPPLFTSAPLAGTRRRIAGFDSLRALALVAVLVFHIDPRSLPGGFIGVDLFFVLSGFLITAHLLQEKAATGRINLRAFYARRLRRVVPAATLVVAGGLGLAVLIGGDVLVGVVPAVVGALTFTSNWVQLSGGGDYFAAAHTGPFENFWSLAIEEQFYLLWPVVILLLWRTRRHRLNRVLVVGTMLAGSITIGLGLAGLSGVAYLATPGHAFGLLLGALVASVHQRWENPRVGASPAQRLVSTGLLLGGAAIVVAVSLDPLAGLPAWRPLATIVGSLAGAGLVIGCISVQHVMLAATDRGALGWLGRRSYGIYLWHFPLIVFADAVAPVFAELQLPMIGRVLAVGLALVLAALSYRFVEQPVLHNGFVPLLKRPRFAVSLASVTVALIGLTILAGAVAPAHTQAEQASAGGTSSGTSSSESSSPPDFDPDADLYPGPDDEYSEPDVDVETEGGSDLTPRGGRGAGRSAGAQSIVAVGDSVMVAASEALATEFPGIRVDAEVGRQLSTASIVVADDIARHPEATAVVIGLGVNGTGDLTDLRSAIEAADGRPVVLVSVSAPVSFESWINEQIGKAAEEHDNVAVADWRSAARAHPELLASDGIHPDSGGAKLYASAVRSALASLGQ
jgi:peptidoglycan/LPS O-acetylase OafA/YrhL